MDLKMPMLEAVSQVNSQFEAQSTEQAVSENVEAMNEASLQELQKLMSGLG